MKEQVELLKQTYLGKCADFMVNPQPVLIRDIDTHLLNEQVLTAVNLPGNCKDMFGKRMVNLDILAVAEALQTVGFSAQGAIITSLSAPFNTLGDEGAAAIANLLKLDRALDVVNLHDNDIQAEGCKEIARSLHENASLTQLDLSQNPLGNEGGMCVAEMLRANNTLTELDLSNSDQKTESMIAIATVMWTNNSLETLHLNRPNLFSLQEETTVHIARMLRVNSTLSTLSLSAHGMRDFGVEQLVEHLEKNVTLTRLDISDNKISVPGAKAVASLLARPDCPLAFFNMSNNPTKDDGADAIGAALAQNTSLIHLDVRSNMYSDRGLVSIQGGLSDNHTLHELRLWGNNFGQEAVGAFHKHFSEVFSLGDTDFCTQQVDGNNGVSNMHIARLQTDVVRDAPIMEN